MGGRRTGPSVLCDACPLGPDALRARRWGQMRFDRARWGRIRLGRARPGETRSEHPRTFRSRAVALQPAERAAAYSQGRKPLDSRPTLRPEPPDGGDRPFPAHPDRPPLRGLAALPGAGIPRLPPGAIGGRLLPEPAGTRPGLNTTGRTPRPHTGPTFMPHNRYPLAPRCRLSWVRGPTVSSPMGAGPHGVVSPGCGALSFGRR